jgi:DNA recombination protein RmuC
MLLAVVLLQVLLLLVCLALLLRKPASPAQATDPRQLQLPDQITHLHARHESLDTNLRTGLAEIRRDAAADALATRETHTRGTGELRAELTATLNHFREDNAAAAAGLRTEVLGSVATLGNTLKAELASFRQDNADAARKLLADVHGQHEAIQQRLGASAQEGRELQNAARELLDARITQLTASNTAHHERIGTTVGERLDKLNAANTAKLEEMRATVDEKLHATLHTRLTESFGQVTDQLNKVHTGLGEMSKLSEGVDDLSRIFTNVKSRGGFAEVQLGMLLEQMLAPSQFVRNARVKPNTLEVVEFAVRFPGHSGETLLPIDAKFPREDWERLEAAYAANDPELLSAAGRAFEAAIRTEGKRICEKYINPPQTTPHAIMFLPTEGLYAEVMRRDALQAEIQSKCQVTIAGPSTLSAILTSFQMGFHMLALQEKGDEVWKVLEKTKTEFKNFEGLMGSMEKQVGTVQNTLQKLGVRTRAINKELRAVSETSANAPLEFEEGAGLGLHLAAGGEE